MMPGRRIGGRHPFCVAWKMRVERVKYVIWAADTSRAVRFYRDVLGGERRIRVPEPRPTPRQGQLRPKRQPPASEQ